MIRVASWPNWYAPNRYLELFHRALAAHGIEHVTDQPLDAGTMARAGVDVAHLHWVEWAWQARGRLEWSRRRGVRALGGFLEEAESLGILVAWTVHNVRPHERGGRSDDDGLRLMHERARLRIFHSAHAREEALAAFGGSGDTIVMPHGNYDGVLPAPRDGVVVRRELGLGAGDSLLLLAGYVRPYKGVDLAAAALDAGLAARGCHLLVVGRTRRGAERWLRALAGGRPAMRVEPGDLDDQRLADLHAASDVVLLPYSEISGSGALLAALTAGRPVVTTPLPYFREVLSPEPDARVIADGFDAGAIARAVERCLVDPERRRGAARRLADHYAWDRVATPVAEWLRRHVPA